MQYTFRPMPTWPHAVTKPRSYPHFKAAWRTTLDELAYEIEKLGGRDCVIGAGFRDSDIRLDGMPRANARQDPYMHPGVEISFDSRFGRLTYATDQYTDWRANVRAIVLSLEALRAVDRYGVSKRGQQYAGWARLAAGESLEEKGRRLVEEAGGSIKEALKRHHPDVGGTTEDAAAINAYRALQAGLSA
jgi:hypothetical protein